MDNELSTIETKLCQYLATNKFIFISDDIYSHDNLSLALATMYLFISMALQLNLIK